jgi:hypothetical protein
MSRYDFFSFLSAVEARIQPTDRYNFIMSHFNELPAIGGDNHFYRLLEELSLRLDDREIRRQFVYDISSYLGTGTILTTLANTLHADDVTKFLDAIDARWRAQDQMNGNAATMPQEQSAATAKNLGKMFDKINKQNPETMNPSDEQPEGSRYHLRNRWA